MVYCFARLHSLIISSPSPFVPLCLPQAAYLTSTWVFPTPSLTGVAFRDLKWNYAKDQVWNRDQLGSVWNRDCRTNIGYWDSDSIFPDLTIRYVFRGVSDSVLSCFNAAAAEGGQDHEEVFHRCCENDPSPWKR